MLAIALAYSMSLSGQMTCKYDNHRKESNKNGELSVSPGPLFSTSLSHLFLKNSCPKYGGIIVESKVRYTSEYLKQSTSWSLTMPVACICAYTTVLPTNLNPRFFRSLLMVSDRGVVAGASL